MTEEKRFNNGYRIIESHLTGEMEIVIGHNPHAHSPYVCWYCRNGTEYLMGYYGDDFTSVHNKLWERFHHARASGRYFNGHREGDAYGK